MEVIHNPSAHLLLKGVAPGLWITSGQVQFQCLQSVNDALAHQKSKKVLTMRWHLGVSLS
jgi:hypothetical protein